MIREYLNIWRFRGYNRNRERINQENQSGVKLILFFYMAIVIMNLLGQLVSAVLVAETCYGIFACLLYLFVLRKKDSDYTVWIYIFEIPILAVTIYTGTIGKPDSLTFTFLFLLLLFPLLILDKPWRLILFILISAGIYAAADFGAKEPALVSRDMLHLFNVTLMSVSATLYTLAARIQNIEFADYFAQKAVRDPLTGLYNRAGAAQYADTTEPCILLYIDLDNFKIVNDTYGHAAGDRILQKTAEVLRTDCRSDDIIIRLGGDEFAVYSQGIWAYGELESRLSRILDDITRIRTSSEKGDAVTISASLGCVRAEEGCESLDQMLSAADKAMYQVKQSGKNRYSVVNYQKNQKSG